MTATHRERPDASEYAPFYAGYVAGVPDGDIVPTMRKAGDDLIATLAAIPESKGAYRYADGKWSVREVIGHMIDAERIFSYRALRIGRGDATPLPGFEEGDYSKTAGSDSRTMKDLVAEMASVRVSTLQLLESFPEDAWMHRGVASNAAVSTRAIAWIMTGHAIHHLKVLKERYGI